MSDYRAITVVSPMCQAGEQKNQDRAYWFQPGSVGAVCDGVTTSPSSEEAAELVASSSQALFNGAIRERLHMVCDLLVARRLEATSRNIRLPPNTSPAMQEMLASVAKDNVARSYQTTLVAMSLTPGEQATTAQVVQCGDSALFAFSPDAGLLTASIGESPCRKRDGREQGLADTAAERDRIRFGPGDELLAKVVCAGKNSQALMRNAGIKAPQNWVICQAIDRCSSAGESGGKAGEPRAGLFLDRDDLLFAPKYLVGSSRDPRYRNYCLLPFARTIRVVRPAASRPKPVPFDQDGSVTAVLPDHFYSGNWQHFQERYPLDAHFVLASDGFYRAFSGPEDLWDWLKAGEAHLRDPSRREDLLASLHIQLEARSSDDDISFIWVCPDSHWIPERTEVEDAS